MIKQAICAVAVLMPLCAISGTVHPNRLNQCTTITAHFFENGIYNAGDTDDLSGMKLADQKAFALRAIRRPGNSSELFTSKSKACELHIHFSSGGAI